MIAVNADTSLVLQGQHLNRLSGNLSMDFARFRPLFLAAIATLAGASAEAGQAPSGLGDLVPGLLPAVVNIYSLKIVPQPDGQTSRVTAAASYKKESLGSGFIIDSAGVIVTNEHVIEHAYDISVTLQDNMTLKAQIIGASAVADVALLRVNAARPLPIVRLGDSQKLRIGDPVFAIGNPFGFGGSVSAGIVSALNRDIMLSPYDDYIQTDAAINHGNSGGPLFNSSGEVIGINTALYNPNGETGIGLGFAIPWNDANFVVQQLRQNGRVRAGYLGADLQQVTSDIAAAVGLPAIAGAIINELDPGGSADRAGLRQGDVILRANGRELKDARAVARAVAMAPIGAALALGVWRDNKEQTIPVTVAEWRGNEQQTAVQPVPRPPPPPDLGLQLSPITDAFRELYRLPADREGVLVTGVMPLSPADDRGLRAGDLILSVQMVQVKVPADVTQQFERMRQQGKQYVLVLMWGNNATKSIALPLSSGSSEPEQAAPY
jgi:serine protease Do